MSESARPEKKKPLIAAMVKGPGPAAYQLPRQVLSNCSTLGSSSPVGKKGPAFTFSGKIVEQPNSASPAPNSFTLLSRITRTGTAKSPQYSMQGRWVAADLETRAKTPGPSDYNPQFTGRKAFQFKFAGQRPETRDIQKPGPGQYNIPSIFDRKIPRKPMTAPAAIKERLPTPVAERQPTPAERPQTAVKSQTASVGSKLQQISEPQKRDSKVSWADLPMKLQEFGKDAPKVTLKGRIGSSFLPKEASAVPGPNQYLPKPLFEKSPQYTFRVKHSEYEQYVPEAVGNKFVYL